MNSTVNREQEIKQQAALIEKLRYFLKEDIDAVRFCIDFVFICHLWDDLIDKDKERTDTDINDAFLAALVEIPGNPFYMRHMHVLRPVILNIILQWEDANTLERGSDHDKQMAWMLRAGMLQIFNVCAYLVGGPAWAREVGPGIRRMYEETLHDFMEEMSCQTQ